jgi:cell division protein FtsW (lipid II flippase)
MNPRYLWLTEALELFTLFLIAPTVSLLIAYRTWRARKLDPKRYAARCVAFAIIGLLLFAFARWMELDVRSPKYLFYLACMLLSFLSLGVSQGYFFSVLLDLWRWHKTTRLNS